MKKEEFISKCIEKQKEVQEFLNKNIDDFDYPEEDEEDNFDFDKEFENDFCEMLIPPIYELLKDNNITIDADGSCEDEWIAAAIYIYTYLMVFLEPFNFTSNVVTDDEKDIKYFVHFNVKNFGDLYDLIGE